MDYLTQTINEFLDDPSTTDSKVFETVQYILSNAGDNCLGEFCRTSITPSDAANIAFASPSACDSYFESKSMSPELIIQHLPIKQLAYHLAFTEPDKATELFNELLYYHTKGRI